MNSVSDHFRWARLGWYDLNLTYRRTLLGPFWQSVQLIIWSAGLALVFGPMHADDPLYIPYLVSGMAIWNFLSSAIVQGSSVFVANTSLILSMPVDPISLVVRQWTNLVLRFFFQIVVFLPILFMYDLLESFRLFEFLTALAMLCIFIFPIIVILGYITTYFRDLEHLVAVAMRFLFFMTPVFWVPQSGQFQAAFVKFNPLYYPLEIVRRPMLGSEGYVDAWIVVGLFIVVGGGLGWLLNRWFSDKLPTWL